MTDNYIYNTINERREERLRYTGPMGNTKWNTQHKQHKILHLIDFHKQAAFKRMEPLKGRRRRSTQHRNETFTDLDLSDL